MMIGWSAMMGRRLLRAALVAAILLAATATRATAVTREDGITSCPGSFHVLHDNRVGSIELPAGAYAFRAAGLDCPTAASLFAQFLTKVSGILPVPWTVTSTGPGQATFHGPDLTGFSVSRTGPLVGRAESGGGGGADLSCSTAYRLLHRDRIRSLRLARGRYRITLTGRSGGMTCARAARLLTEFSEDFDGKLPRRWVLLPKTRTFVRDTVSYGFRIARWTGKDGSGGPTSRRERRCPGWFLVVHFNRVGVLNFPPGRYYLDVRGMTCARAVVLFPALLLAPPDALPAPWTLSPSTGTFRDGAASFQAKPAFRIP
jgi:hypothetical protein